MVVFTCQHCGDSLQKPKVEKHYFQTRCRSKNPVLTCVDCLKDFIGYDYNEHTQCVTEEQRYAPKGMVFKECKGQSKQLKYTEMIQNILNTKEVGLNTEQRKLLEVCSNHQNVPRKWPKFQNFIKCVARSLKYTENDLKFVFKLLEDSFKELAVKANTSDQEIGRTATEPCKGDIVLNDTDDNDKTSTNSETIAKEENKLKHITEAHDCISEQETVDESKINNCLHTKSKKELKKRKRYEKYLSELHVQECKISDHESKTDDETNTKSKQKTVFKNGILNTSKTSANNCESNDENNSNYEKPLLKHNKKSKKNTDRWENEEMILSSNVDNQDNGNALGQKTKEAKSKMSKKRKRDCSLLDGNGKRKKIFAPVEECGAFDWAGKIVKILETRSDKELALNRLAKKVVLEYQTLNQETHLSYDQLLAKFNKKIKKTQGVRVLKDKAKLYS